MKRESFRSRLGFLLVSAGCAIGIGNVWRFPYVTGKNGGGYFVLFYILCRFWQREVPIRKRNLGGCIMNLPFC